MIVKMKGGAAMIWCVEDDASIRDIEVYALTSTGFEARGFEDGTSFWDALQRSQPELVVLDVMLPGIDGVELLKRMKASEELQNIPVIMATAKGTEYDKIQSLDLGADDYLVKPFGIMEMVSRVKAVLRRCKRTHPVKLFSIDGLNLNKIGIKLRGNTISSLIQSSNDSRLSILLSVNGASISVFLNRVGTKRVIANCFKNCSYSLLLSTRAFINAL